MCRYSQLDAKGLDEKHGGQHRDAREVCLVSLPVSRFVSINMTHMPTHTKLLGPLLADTTNNIKV